jgi:hypothetical protein
MIRDKAIAGEVNKLMLDYGAKLDASLVLVKDRCSSEEFVAYRTVVGKILGEMLLEVMNPIYLQHPDLKPPELK